MVKTPGFHYRGCWFDPWWGTKILNARPVQPSHQKKKKKAPARVIYAKTNKQNPTDTITTKKNITKISGNFPGSPVVKTPSFQCRGYGFDAWSGK